MSAATGLPYSWHCSVTQFVLGQSMTPCLMIQPVGRTSPLASCGSVTLTQLPSTQLSLVEMSGAASRSSSGWSLTRCARSTWDVACDGIQ